MSITLVKKEERLRLITRNMEEVLTKDDLSSLISSGTQLCHYIGFEISGKVHLGTGLISMGKVADFLKAGVKCNILLADFHSYLNNKLGGNWENIRKASEGYFKSGLIASLLCFGVDVEKEVKAGNLTFVMGKDLYEKNIIHWETFMEVGKHITLSRNLRSISIMGKNQGAEVDMATLFYPPLQVADIFTLGVNIAHAGIDQRKAHVVARSVAKKLKINPLKDKSGKVIAPVAVHQNLIAGLSAPSRDDLGKDTADVVEDLKMSKSKPSSAIFIHDLPNEIREKIAKAYCPPKETRFNPIINWVEFLVFWGEEKGKFLVNRKKEFGGPISYQQFSDLEKDYRSGKLHPVDLKNMVADWLINKLEPARKYFSKPKVAQSLEFMEKALNGS
jgi:tyrosyl-tRNA synthetase